MKVIVLDRGDSSCGRDQNNRTSRYHCYIDRAHNSENLINDNKYHYWMIQFQNA